MTKDSSWKPMETASRIPFLRLLGAIHNTKSKGWRYEIIWWFDTSLHDRSAPSGSWVINMSGGCVDVIREPDTLMYWAELPELPLGHGPESISEAKHS